MLGQSTIGLSPDELATPRTAEVEGDVIEGRLAQLALDVSKFRVLAEVQLLADAGESFGPEEWDAVEAALVRAEKKLETQAWHSKSRRPGCCFVQNGSPCQSLYWPRPIPPMAGASSDTQSAEMP